MALPNPSMTFTPFDPLTASEMNDLVENIEALSDGSGLEDGAIKPKALLAGTGTSWAWQSFTPTLTNVTEGNGTKVAYYKQVGKTVYFRVRFTYGSTSSASGAITVSLPVTASSNYSNNDPIGTAYVDDSGVATYNGSVNIASTTTCKMYIPNTSTDTRIVQVSNTKPSAPGTGDSFSIEGTYEAA